MRGIILFWLSFEIQIIFGCSSRAAIEYSRRVRQAQYSVASPHYIEKTTLITNDEFYGRTAGEPVLSKYHCTNLFPGLQNLVHGSKHHFFEDAHEIRKKPYSPFISLTCSDAARTDRVTGNSQAAFVLPDQLQEVRRSPISSYSERFQSFEDLNDCIRNAKQKVEGWWMGILSFFRSIETPISQHVTHITTLETRSFDAHLQPNLISSVTNTFNNSYHNLPLHFEGNENVFKMFLDRFGCCYYTKATYGGQLVISIALAQAVDRDNLLPPTEFAGLSIERILDGVKRRMAGKGYLETKVFSIGGTLDLNSSIHEWATTVVNNPIVLGGDLVPFPVLFNDTERIQAFHSAMENEDCRIELQKQRIVIASFHSLHTFITSSLLSILDEEIVRLRPRKFVSDALHDLLSRDPHFELTSLTQTCDGDLPFITRYIMFKGFCSTPSDGFAGCGSTEAWSGTMSRLCVVLYSHGKCIGINTTITSFDGLSAAVKKAWSWRLCDA